MQQPYQRSNVQGNTLHNLSSFYPQEHYSTSRKRKEWIADRLFELLWCNDVVRETERTILHFMSDHGRLSLALNFLSLPLLNTFQDIFFQQTQHPN